MSGEKNLEKLIKEMTPILNIGTYVFTTISSYENISRLDTLFEFKEPEGITVVIKKEKADELQLAYHFIASWITLKIHSSLEAVGLTAIFSTALAKHKISCNVVAGYYHDHIFVAQKDEKKALAILLNLSNTY